MAVDPPREGELRREIEDARKELKQEIADVRREPKQDLKEVEQRLTAKIDTLAAQLRGDLLLLRWMIGVGITIGIGILVLI